MSWYLHWYTWYWVLFRMAESFDVYTCTCICQPPAGKCLYSRIFQNKWKEKAFLQTPEKSRLVWKFEESATGTFSRPIAHISFASLSRCVPFGSTSWYCLPRPGRSVQRRSIPVPDQLFRLGSVGCQAVCPVWWLHLNGFVHRFSSLQRWRAACQCRGEKLRRCAEFYFFTSDPY